MTTLAPGTGRGRPPNRTVHADRLARLRAEASAPDRPIEHLTPAGSR